MIHESGSIQSDRKKHQNADKARDFYSPSEQEQGTNGHLLVG